MAHKALNSILNGYKKFYAKYVQSSPSMMQHLSLHGQKPEVMVIACSDSRVDPAVLFQCDPGELFVVRNIANLVPPYKSDGYHHSTSAALEFGICELQVKHLIILGHSECGGVQAKLNKVELKQDDFISRWTDLITVSDQPTVNELAKETLVRSYQNCLTFPWLKSRIYDNKLEVHRWFFELSTAKLYRYDLGGCCFRAFSPLLEH